MKKFIFSVLIIIEATYAYGQLDTLKVKNVVNAWNAAHNSQDIDMLSELYAPSLIFYSKELIKDVCLKEKLDAFASYSDFKQNIVSAIVISTYEGGVIKCDFTKEVIRTSKKRKDAKTNTYPSYLLLRQSNNQFFIVGESDLITDSNTAFVLNLGKQVEFADTSDKSWIAYIVICSIIVGLILLIVVLQKRSKKKNDFEENKSETTKAALVNEHKIQVELIENIVSPPIVEEVRVENREQESSINNTKKATTQLRSEAINAEKIKNVTKDYLATTYKNTTTFLTKLFDTVDFIDRNLYGQRMRIFILGCFLVLIAAPILDLVLGVDWITFLATFLFLIFVLVTILAFIGSWRDDNGNVTWARVWSRIQTYSETIKDTVSETKTTSTDEVLYKLGRILFFVGIGWKALQNLSVFVRKPIEWFGIRLDSLRTFEKITNQQWYWVLILAGVGILFYLYKKNPKILERIQNELRQLIGWKQNENSKYSLAVVKFETKATPSFVVNAKAEHQFDSVTNLSNSKLFKDFALAVQNWKPQTAHYEWQYQDRLYRHLRKYLPEASIELEYPVGDKSMGNNGRADIVINDTILIEMKRDSSAGAIQRAKGQISQYSDAWKDKGPVILLLCDYDYDHAKLVYSSHMDDLVKLGKPVLTIVAKPKAINIHA